MISLFRKYNPVNTAWLVLVVILLRLVYIAKAPDKLDFIFVETFTRSLVPVAYENAFSPVINILLAALLVYGQALLVNYVANFYNLLGRPSFLPALMFVVASSIFTPFLILSPPLICNFLVIWMIFKMLALYKADNANALGYDLGMLVAVGSLIYLPFIYFMVLVWIAFIIFRPFNIREWLSTILGYITIFFFLAVYYYMTDRIDSFFNIWLPLGTKLPTSIVIKQYTYVLLIPVAVFFFLSFTKISALYYKSYIHSRKGLILMVLIFLIAGLSFYVKAEFRLSHFLLCALPTAIFFAYYFLYAKWKWFYETLFLLFVAGIIFFQFNNF
ncbi:DUF6427 family protein [Mucilaginibacter ginkgonis]|uniref:Beta-carotene 15,15'-monooxygenase n=1 Tax=Mucilaginibacter ginkgonis TaxID=2682091 RepID=A0A6I4HZX5_9SPHI|nr:DUF6427 family protein [Mucilaginibacter ginkgonis]QQL48814.1 beta-carotene 15,15'-monooxygenase [Mucilaginibacter ginkgonis]